MLTLVVNIVITGLFRVNIGLDGGALLFAGGWTCRNYQVKCGKLKLKFWFGVLKTCIAHKRYLELILTSTEKTKTLNLLKMLTYGILISYRRTRVFKQLFV